MHSEHRRKPKNARRNMDSRVESVEGNKCPVRTVRMQWIRRSALRGRRFGASWGSTFRRPLISMLTWG